MVFGYNLNANLAEGFNTAFSTSATASIFMWIELAFLLVFAAMMIGFIFSGKPNKQRINRKFYPIKPNSVEE